MLKISVDSLNPKKHEEFRGVAGIFSSILKNIISLRKAGIVVMINTVLNRENKNEIADLIRYFVLRLGCAHTLIAHISAMGRGKERDAQEINLSPRELLVFLNKVYFPTYRKIQRIKKGNFLYLEFPKAFMPKDIKIFPKCDWGTRVIGVSVNGRISICHYADNNSPFLTYRINKKKNLLDIWLNAPLFKKLRMINENNLKGVCGNCKFAPWCRGLCRIYAYQVYKDFYAPYPVCQRFYNEGLFPRKSLVNPRKNSRYPI